MTHIPTGLTESSQTRSREGSYRTALENLKKRLSMESELKANNEISSIRKNQVGSGMRGDKIRTYRFKDNIVKDHLSNKSISCEKIMNGYFDLIWK
jgi:peptide chain release factor 1